MQLRWRHGDGGRAAAAATRRDLGGPPPGQSRVAVRDKGAPGACKCRDWPRDAGWGEGRRATFRALGAGRVCCGTLLRGPQMSRHPRTCSALLQRAACSACGVPRRHPAFALASACLAPAQFQSTLARVDAAMSALCLQQDTLLLGGRRRAGSAAALTPPRQPSLPACRAPAGLRQSLRVVAYEPQPQLEFEPVPERRRRRALVDAPSWVGQGTLAGGLLALAAYFALHALKPLLFRVRNFARAQQRLLSNGYGGGGGGGGGGDGGGGSGSGGEQCGAAEDCASLCISCDACLTCLTRCITLQPAEPAASGPARRPSE